MKKSICACLWVLGISIAYGQRSDGSLPYSFTYISGLPMYPHTWTVPRPAAEIETLENSLSPDKMYDFGVAVPLPKNLLESPSKTLLPDGRAYIRQPIHAPGAYGINLNFKTFRPGQSGKLWVVSADAEAYIGGFDRRSVTPGIPFATAPVRGETVYLEFIYDPAEEGIAVELAEAVYEFADIFEVSRAFGSSGGCNRNVNCPEYAAYSDAKRSVAMILTSNNVRWCSGAMVNNTAQDGKPYLLTARHCNTTPNSIFMFNYESPDCSNIDGPTGQTIQGCTIRVDWDVSDVTLVELSSPPPTNFFAYFSGWNASPQAADSVAGIHHPKGDIKKISFDTNTVVSASYAMGDTALSHWRILNWETGTTEGGSSGSPLFNTDKQIVGQLHGGQASCANSASDYYGKFAYSWNGENTPATGLKFWLDPGNTGATELDGTDFNAPQYDYDLAVTGLAGPDSVYCRDSADWVVSVRNNGMITAQAFRVRLFRNGAELAVKEVNQSLSFGNVWPVSFTGVAMNEGNNAYSATVEFLSPLADENPADNSLARTVQRVEADAVTVTFRYDLFSSETKWGIYELDGSLVYQSSSAAAHEVMVRSFCLPTGCYLFRVTDAGNDGICCSGGEGSFEIRDGSGTAVVTNQPFGNLYEEKFCVPGLPETWDKLFEIYPNPAVSQINVKLQDYAEGVDGELLIFSTDGKILVNRKGTLKYLNTFDVSEWAQGVYFVRVSAGKLKSVQKFIKNR